MSQLYQGDFDLGRRAVERLAGEDLGLGVLVEDLHYGAVAVTQRLEEVRPETLILVGAVRRHRPPGTVERRRVGPRADPATVQAAVADAVTGHVDLDLLIDVAAGFGALPERTVSIEVEPARTAPSESLTPEAAAGLEHALDLVRAEARRAPLFSLAGQLRALVTEERLAPAPAVAALRDLLDGVALLEREGRWGGTFRQRDRLRQAIAGGGTGAGMSYLDWGLWWALLEELDRLQPLEARDV